MATISASAVKDLREKTGVGMMDAKKALEEAGGDVEKAVDILRKKGLSAAAKKADRVASEGMIAFTSSGKTGVLVEVNSETDFVSKNPEFQQFAKTVAELVAAQNPADVAALSLLKLGSESVEARRQTLVQKIGENISIRRYSRYATTAQLVQYLHGGGRIGVTVEIEGGQPQVGKDVAMHIAASAAPGAIRPVCVSRADVPADLIERERAIYTAQAAESGKPAEIAARMVEGRVNKFLAEVTLLGQAFVKNPDETVEKYLKANGAAVKSFELFVVGEGIERRKDDFAAEVAAMVKA